MPSYETEVRHALSREEAKERVRAFVPQLRQRFGAHVDDVHEAWVRDTLELAFTTFGTRIRCSATVADDRVTVEYYLPLTAVMFRGTVEEAIRTGLADALVP